MTNGTKYRKTQHGNYRFKRYENYRACQRCALRPQCTKRPQGRQIERPVHQSYTDRNNQRVRRYPNFYRLRQQIVEPIFGTWKRHWGMTYTLLKGKESVATEYRLAAICTNLCRSLSVLGGAELKKRLRALILAILALRRPVAREDSKNGLFYPELLLAPVRLQGGCGRVTGGVIS